MDEHSATCKSGDMFNYGEVRLEICAQPLTIGIRGTAP
jgi:hypothetical protein